MRCPNPNCGAMVQGDGPCWNCGAKMLLEIQQRTKVRRKIEDLIRKDEGVLNKVAAYLNIK